MDALGDRLSDLCDLIADAEARNDEDALIPLLKERSRILCSLADLAEAGGINATVIGMDLAAAYDAQRVEDLTSDLEDHLTRMTAAAPQQKRRGLWRGMISR